LHEALMLGGEAAAKAGFTIEEASQNSPLWADKKKEDAPSADVNSDDQGGYQGKATTSSYV
jgi:hypothetical protein